MTSAFARPDGLAQLRSTQMTSRVAISGVTFGHVYQVGDAGLLFDPLSADDIAEKTCMLLASPQLRGQLIERGLRRIASVNHDEYALRLAELIDSLGETGDIEPR